LDASEEKTRWKEEKKLLYFEKLSRFTLFFSLGYQFIKTDSKVITQAERKKTAWLFKKKEPKQTEGLSKP
jgi:hypothetical protein